MYGLKKEKKERKKAITQRAGRENKHKAFERRRSEEENVPRYGKPTKGAPIASRQRKVPRTNTWAQSHPAGVHISSLPDLKRRATLLAYLPGLSLLPFRLFRFSPSFLASNIIRRSKTEAV